MWGETEGLMLLFWSALFVGGRVVRREGWGYGMARWESWEGSEVGGGWVGRVRKGNVVVARWGGVVAR